MKRHPGQLGECGIPRRGGLKAAIGRGGSSAVARLAFVVASSSALGGCCMFERGAPESEFPSARAAIDRMRATYACSRGVTGEAKIDYFGDEGRVRGRVFFKTQREEALRFDVFTTVPTLSIISTLTSDGKRFALSDIPNKTFWTGPASACNVARFTRVSVPPFALVQMLGGEAPVLVHQDSDATIGWQCGGYQVDIKSKHGAAQRIRLVPLDVDWEKPWQEQRVRVEQVEVSQQGYVLYAAELKDHRSAKTAAPWQDPDGIDPDVPPSGPSCNAQLPMRVRLAVPTGDQDLILQYEEVAHNPPLPGGAGANFGQPTPGGVQVRQAICSD